MANPTTLIVRSQSGGNRMPTQPPQPPVLEARSSLLAIAPRSQTSEVDTTSEAGENKRKRNDSEEPAKQKKQRAGGKNAWCPLCHLGFASLTTRNNHIGIRRCFQTAKDRELITEYRFDDAWKKMAANKEESIRSNKLVNLKDSSERFEAGGRSKMWAASPSSSGPRTPLAVAPGQHQQYRAAFERTMTEPLIISPSTSMPPHAGPHSQLQASVSFGGYNAGSAHRSYTTAAIQPTPQQLQASTSFGGYGAGSAHRSHAYSQPAFSPRLGSTEIGPTSNPSLEARNAVFEAYYGPQGRSPSQSLSQASTPISRVSTPSIYSQTSTPSHAGSSQRLHPGYTPGYAPNQLYYPPQIQSTPITPNAHTRASTPSQTDNFRQLHAVSSRINDPRQRSHPTEMLDHTWNVFGPGNSGPELRIPVPQTSRPEQPRPSAVRAGASGYATETSHHQVEAHTSPLDGYITTGRGFFKHGLYHPEIVHEGKVLADAPEDEAELWEIFKALAVETPEVEYSTTFNEDWAAYSANGAATPSEGPYTEGDAEEGHKIAAMAPGTYEWNTPSAVTDAFSSGDSTSSGRGPNTPSDTMDRLVSRKDGAENVAGWSQGMVDLGANNASRSSAASPWYIG
ncbi:hypothetical protein B0H19DRAFT_1273405 [Mycena capillaripes]|nr:hypothetical protein B0H19DRAFT_1273405 [Mycena capillaripes]